MNTMGSRIAARRKEKGMTQEELALKMGVSAQAVSKWENDASCPDISLLPRLCRILGITSDELLTGDNSSVKMLPPSQRKSMDELTLRVKIHTVRGDKVRVNLPMSLVKVAMELGVEISPSISGVKAETLKEIDLKKIVDLVERGAIGKLVEVETAEGDTVEVVVE